MSCSLAKSTQRREAHLQPLERKDPVSTLESQCQLLRGKVLDEPQLDRTAPDSRGVEHRAVEPDPDCKMGGSEFAVRSVGRWRPNQQARFAKWPSISTTLFSSIARATQLDRRRGRGNEDRDRRHKACCDLKSMRLAAKTERGSRRSGCGVGRAIGPADPPARGCTHRLHERGRGPARALQCALAAAPVRRSVLEMITHRVRGSPALCYRPPAPEIVAWPASSAVESARPPHDLGRAAEIESANGPLSVGHSTCPCFGWSSAGRVAPMFVVSRHSLRMPRSAC